MKTLIEITGQIKGNSTLYNALDTLFAEVKKLNNGGYQITYDTKGEAVKALSAAFQMLKYNEPDYYLDDIISYMRGYCLNYDASRAELITLY